MIFETKKVPLETLGEYLAEIRTHLGLSVSEVAEKTGIGDKFLHYLESGSYHRLPPEVYVLGFLKKLADLYAVSAETLVSQYKKERGIVEQLANEKVSPKQGIQSWLKKLVVTPKLISLFGGVGISFIAVFYIIFQVSAINRTPVLDIKQPTPGTVVKDSMVTVAGKTDPGTSIAINGQNVLVGTDGSFTTALGVSSGQKELLVTAQNKYGKMTSQKLTVIVDPAVSGATSDQSAASAKDDAQKLSMELKFIRSTTITLSRDGVDLPEEVVPANGIKRINADEKVTVKTSDAGSTLVTINGKELGALGRDHESIAVPFTTDNQLWADQSLGTNKN